MTSIAQAAAQPGPASSTYQFVAPDLLVSSPTNPRKNFDAVELAELAKSIKEVGIVEPVIVREIAGGKLEIVAGERRCRAAKLAEITQVPVLIRSLTDVQVLEIQVIENLQRKDLSALEEADGYRQLVKAGYDVARIASRIGRSAKYVYDRIKLLALTKEAKELLRDGRISAGHAILLARLKPEDQERAIEDGVFTEERLLAFGGDEQPDNGEKAVSVRELEDWIDRHVRFEATEADPVLFPETVATVKAATDEKEKVVRVTHSVMTPDELRQGPPAVLGQSWKRADGLMGSKTCDHSVIGQVVLGEDRGKAFNVCVAKKKCAVHWPEQARAAKKVKKAATQAVARGEDPDEARKRTAARETERQKYEDARWEKALPALTSALVAAAKKAPAGGSSGLGKMLVREHSQNAWGQAKQAFKLLPPGGGADSLVRCLGLAQLLNHYENGDAVLFETDAKAIGVDIKAILAAALPPLPTCRECGCTEAVACAGGCSWLEEPDKKTGRGLCSSPKCAAKRKGAKPAKPARSGSAQKKRNATASARA